MSVYQTNALEFTITSRLGGTRRNALFSVDEEDDDYAPPDDHNIRHFTVDELGVIDLSLVPGSTSIGARFVPWIWLNAPAAPTAGACEIVDAQTLRVMREVFGSTSGSEMFRAGVVVPQGAALKFGTWEVPAGGRPIRLRIGLAPPANTLQWAMLKQAFCCLESAFAPYMAA